MKLAVIPARGGSQRIPRKNIRDFCGKPIIAYSVRAAVESGCFDEVMVSTDDNQIASIARSFGAKVPFLRSAEASSHTATTVDVLREVLKAYQDRGQNCTELCCIYPTAPFVSPAILKRGFELLLEKPETNAVISIVRFSYPIQRALRLTGDQISMFQPEHATSRSQDLEPGYHDAGQFYWVKTDRFQKSVSLMGPGTVGLVRPEMEVQDIDTDEDWLMAEMKFTRLREKARP